MNITDQSITQREMEVLQLLSLGLSYEKIAKRMNVSHETIKKHLKNIYRKLKAIKTLPCGEVKVRKNISIKLQVNSKIEALQKVKLLKTIPRMGNSFQYYFFSYLQPDCVTRVF